MSKQAEVCTCMCLWPRLQVVSMREFQPTLLGPHCWQPRKPPSPPSLPHRIGGSPVALPAQALRRPVGLADALPTNLYKQNWTKTPQSVARQQTENSCFTIWRHCKACNHTVSCISRARNGACVDQKVKPRGVRVNTHQIDHARAKVCM